MRVVLRILSPLLGLALAVLGLLVAIETVSAWVSPDSGPLLVPWPDWQAGATTAAWSSATVRGIAIAVGVVGLLVVLVALAARRHDVHLADPVPEVSMTTSPRSLARAVDHEVRTHSDVVSASVVASERRIVVRAATLDAPDEVRAAVRGRVDELLGRLPLATRPKVSVTVSVTRGVK